jgi:hypothetical protein
MIARAKTAPFRYYRGVMTKPASAKHTKTPQPHSPQPTAAQRAPQPPRNANPNFNQQTRRVLAQHYRAKYGVK